MSTDGGPLRRCWRWIRRRPIRSALMGVALFVVFVPVWPYRPLCDGYSWDYFGTVEGDMTPEYLATIDRALWQQHVYHWRIGDRIYLSLLVLLTPDSDFARYAAQQSVANRLLWPAVDGSYVGQKLLGRTWSPPAYLEPFVDDEGRPIDHHDCTFVRAVAFGEPPPPGYAPVPSPFRGASD